ncbi:adenylate/guanylate cyclase domain-containing protein [Fulvivirga sp. M361]|uniref:adenylate/guanylate cyclase domain-containing protein n=1 Tax=Fulvivirga sp. M361 TaxID=2594266 RepID=UPI00117B8FDB|nr:adenylate/guanylate cyclase domain-containing protein [Fulvivirga sp. M361]TRX48917.1 adenylate/guanylate cyclase domain-containing protein [Fulvivirga sp. M361]
MNKLKIYFLIILYWVVILNLVAYFALVNVLGFIDVTGLNLDELQNPLAKYWTSPIQLVESTLFGLLFGILFVAINELSEKFKVERFSFGYVILFKSLIYLVGFFVSFALVYFIIGGVGVLPEGALQAALVSQTSLKLIFFSFVFLFVQVIVLNFFVQTIKKFGYKNITNFLMGKYQNPVIEDRAFLFMDLKSSTAYAETLGNIKYSKLIKDCVLEINQLVDKFDAEIYQYVGDEVVLTWEMDKLENTYKCIDTFYTFKHRLEKREDYYMKKYGVVPQFKAGLHCGRVTVAEIGNIKRDIAYHGDVLNTASRIQSICNEYQERLLVSGALLGKAGDLNGYKVESIGDVQLKGKQKIIDVHAVREGL